MEDPNGVLSAIGRLARTNDQLEQHIAQQQQVIQQQQAQIEELKKAAEPAPSPPDEAGTP